MSDEGFNCNHVCCPDPEDSAHRHRVSPMYCHDCFDPIEDEDDVA